MIRLATPGDAPQLADIYRPYCEGSPLSFETAAPSAEEMASRIKKVVPQHPWLVAETDGVVAGYAYASRHRERLSYRWTVEVSIYIREGRHGRGLGKALYTALFGILRRQGFVNALAGVSIPNPASERLHRAMGFQRVAVYPNIGFKEGVWRSTEWSQLVLVEPKSPPSEPILLSDFHGSDGWQAAIAEGEALLSRQPATT